MLRKLIGYFRIEHALFLIPISAFAIYDSVFSSFSSILADLSRTYPDVSTVGIQMVLALPSLLSVPATLVSGLLSSYVHKKYIALTAMLMMLMVGAVPVMFPDLDITALLFVSAVIGVGQGLLHPLTNSFVCEYWREKTLRGRVLGFKQAANYLGAAIVSALVGILALSKWNYAFFVYLGILPILFVVIKSLPRGELDKRLISKRDRAAGFKELLKPKAVYFFLLSALGMVFMFAYRTNIAMFVDERGLGSTTDIANIIALLSIVSLAVGICFGKYLELAGHFALVVGLSITAFALLTTTMAQSYAMVVVSSVFFGLGEGIVQISAVYYISGAIDKGVTTIAMSVLQASISVGASVSPILVSWLGAAFFGTDFASTALIVSCIGMALLSIIELFRSYRHHTTQKKGPRDSYRVKQAN